ncbi:transcriptional regulator, AraC family [Anaerocolumna jejuensis DSM 15929]|uniref:Transcriptional regulator, AraC family n=1 Tax=Anaerocolumna jejuensis DSM 15929 TaxID=1121322 RepID=A0A1M7DDQ3_9FIRM|nr:AraC family transcriptional regulator [Anaerocolumna jejuensis]SHL77666.1 transcriptional regulator, AraC family [Anaerocolumna jejuensis DSM 15929]
MNYSQSIQKTISYIDANLSNKLSLDELADIAGFSKYHFLRIFKHETGSRLSEHIQNRRMAQAAKLLLFTQQNILDIALTYRFESQEAFTRAFKKEYNLPPGRYRKAMSNLIHIKEVPDMGKNNLIPGWIITGTVPSEYSVDFDRDIFYKGTRSVRIKGESDNIDDEDYMTVMQQFKARDYIGKRIRFSAFIKTLNVEKWCGLWMRINSTTANIVKFDNMQNRPIKGTNDWNYYSVVLDIPESGNIINIGVLLNGTGTVWMDHVNFEIVDKNVETTDVDLSSELPEKPVNLSLEESNTDLQ